MNSKDIYLREFDEIAQAARAMIQKRQVVEQALREREEQLSLAIAGSGVGLWDWMVKTGEVVFNQRWAEMLGYNLEELGPLTIGTWRKLIHPADLEKMKSLIQEHFDFKTPVFECEVRMKHKEGFWVWVLARGKVVERGQDGMPVRMTGTHLDITERKKADEALAESEERFRSLTINSPVGVMVHTGESVLFVNPALVQMFAAEGEEWVHRPECLGPARSRTPGLRPPAVGKGPGPERGGGGQGISFHQGGRGRLLRRNHGHAHHPGRPGEDLQPAYRRNRTQKGRAGQGTPGISLRQSQKMDALGTLAGGIAHDFNNILAAIIGYSELALEDVETGLDNSPKIKEIVKAGNRAKDLVTQILTFSRKLEPELKPADLNQVVIQTEKMLERTIPKMVRIEHRLSPDLHPINADPVQISQILMNLGTNANDAMPEGGLLLIETDNVFLDRDYCSRQAGVSPGEYVRLNVSDTGIGMNRETQEHIFDPFFTQKGIGKGTGLGLATVYGIVKNHGGHVVCYSEPGQGTTFRVYLPATHTGEKSALNEVAVEAETPGGQETILVVDDEKSIRDLEQQILGRKGYRVLYAGTGEEALGVYRENEGISLVILDISMPGMGGHRCLKELLRLNPAAKVVIVSGYSMSGHLEDALDSGAAGYLAKPFTKTDLLKTVREILDR